MNLGGGVTSMFPTCGAIDLSWKKTSWWFQPIWRIISQNGSFPQIGVNIKNTWSHHLENFSEENFGWKILHVLNLSEKPGPGLGNHVVKDFPIQQDWEPEKQTHTLGCPPSQ